MALAGPWYLTPGTTLQDGVITSTDGAVVDMVKINDEVVYDHITTDLSPSPLRGRASMIINGEPVEIVSIDLKFDSLTWPNRHAYVDPLKDEPDFTTADIKWTGTCEITRHGQAWLRRLLASSAGARQRLALLDQIRSRRPAAQSGQARR